MRILALTNRIPYPLKDGGNIATMQMLESLLNCGFEVKLLSLNTNKHFVELGELPPIFQRMSVESVTLNTDVNMKDAFLNIFTDKSYNAVRFYDEDFKDLIIRTLIQSEYDIVLFEGIYTAMYADHVKQYSKAKCVLRPHNIENEIWFNAARGESFLKKQYIKTLAKRLKKYEVEHWKKFDAVIPISIIDEMIIKDNANTGQLFLTLPTAIDIKKIKAENTDASSDKIFHLGSMDWMPNQQAMKWFLDNVWDTVASSTKAEFFMAGRNMPEEFFSYQSERIHVPGEVDDVYEFMKEKQIMIVPLFAGSGVRIKILEGMAAAKTIVTTSLGVQGIDAYDKEHVLIANNPAAFANAVTWCVKNDRKSKDIGNNARKLIETKYSIESFELQLRAFLMKLVA